MSQNREGNEIRQPVMFCFSSGKGGVGKTSITVNLALTLCQRGFRVLLVDGDLGLANVDVMLGITVKSTIRDLVMQDLDPMEAVIYPEPSLGVLPASSGVPDMVSLGPEDQELLREILKKISRNFDFVLIDTAAGIGPSVMWFNSIVRYNVVVLTPDPTSITDAYALIKVLFRDYHKKNFFLLFNMVKNEKEGQDTFGVLSKVVERFLKITPIYLGSIPKDTKVLKGVREQVPFMKLVQESKAAEAIKRLAEQIEKTRKIEG